MRLEQMIVGVALFGFIILSGVLLIGDVNESYGKNMSTDDFSEVYYTINESYNVAELQKNRTFGSDITTEDAFDSALRGSFSAARQTKNTFTIINDVLNAIAIRLAIPTYVVTFFITAILAIVVFALIYLFVRFQPR